MRARAAEGLLEELTSQLWPSSTVSWSRMDEGLSNYNFTLNVDGRQFFAQVSEASEELGNLSASRTGRIAFTRRAEELNIGPAVVAAGERGDFTYLITEFGGKSLGALERPLTDEIVRKVGESLGALHRSAPMPEPYSWASHPIEGTLRFCNSISSRGPDVVNAIEMTREVSARVHELRGEFSVVPVHADLMPENILWDGERVRLIDWEYSGMGDAVFDLADFTAKNYLSESMTAALVSGWGGVFEAVREIVIAYIPLSVLREAVWACRADELGWRPDVDYLGYAASRVSDARASLEADGWPFG
jgi:Ser/Thr protein kinase RdoA (MazF antagonist)